MISNWSALVSPSPQYPMLTPSFMCKIPFSGRADLVGCDGAA
jgi:hypothetical protein